MKLMSFMLIAVLLLSACSKKEEVQEVGNTDELSSSSEESSQESSASSSAGDGQELPDPDDAPLSSDYSTEPQQVGASGVNDVVINSVKTYGYTTFLRVEFEIEGNEIPLTTAEYSAGSNQVTVNIQNIKEDNSGIAFENSKEVFSSVVSSIFHSAVSDSEVAKYQIGVKQSTSFYLHAVGENPVKLIIDIKEVEDANGGEIPGKDNEFTDKTQKLETDADGNAISIGGYSYSNQGDVFRIVWTLQGDGTNVIPNVTATPITEGSTNKLKVEIENLNADYIAKNGMTADLPDSTVTGMVGSFSSNTSTYTITLSKKTEFKIYSSLAPSQLILDVKR